MQPVDDTIDLGREVGDGPRVVDHVVGVFEFGVEGELGREAGLGVREREVVPGPEALQLENLGAVRRESKGSIVVVHSLGNQGYREPVPECSERKRAAIETHQ